MACFTRFVAQVSLSKCDIPIFLCPVLSVSHSTLRYTPRRRRSVLSSQKRHFQLETAIASRQLLPSSFQLLALPRTCPGCGAFTQTTVPNSAGFYSVNKKSVNAFLNQQERSIREDGKRVTPIRTLGHGDQTLSHDLGIGKTSDLSEGLLQLLPYLQFSDLRPAPSPGKSVPTPVCNRCHDLLHHHTGVSIVHPTLQSIQSIISESPYKYNHIYHVLDAADFPLSLIPQLQRYLSLTPQRSQNRRSKISKFYHGRKADMSFIITRSDLLAPTKEQVDAMMPYLLEVLRDALGASARDVRLGNVQCVSSKRGWWTKKLKEDIWNRGGGGWMVGKVNVGKSNLFECVFPKGRNEEVNFKSLRGAARQSEIDSSTTATESINPSVPQYLESLRESESPADLEEEPLQENALLPPAPPEQSYPVMPIVSSMPGTTASPIRLLFGGGKGELIDLPGLSRGNLENYVIDNHKSDLVMRHFLKPEQFVLKPGQSLLLGRLFRITPITPSVTILAYPFVPFQGHVTSTEKAIKIHAQRLPSGVRSIAKPDVGDKMSSAGTFQLRWDVTRKRAGPLTAPAAVGLNPKVLPFVIFSTDILVEGCGWVELVAQVRKRELESRNTANNGTATEEVFPMVEIFSPEGRHIGARRPMGAWLLGARKRIAANKRTIRPRRSMKGFKKSLKLAKVQQNNTGGN